MWGLSWFCFSFLVGRGVCKSSALDRCRERTCVVTEMSDRWEVLGGSEVRG